jgi:chromosome segregation ATPase
VGLLLYGTQFFGLLRTAKNEIERAAKDAIPMSVQVANAERMVKELDDELRNWTTTVAEQQVTVKNMEEKIAKRETQLNGQKKQILALKAEFDKGEKSYVFDGTTYTQEQVQKDLGVKVQGFKDTQDILNRDKDQLRARRETLTSTESKFQEMVTMKEGLKNEIGFLRARMEQMKADEAVGSLDIDDSKMAEARKAIEEIRTKMDVKEQVRKAEGRLTKPSISVPEKPVTGDISKEIEDLFGDEAKSKTDL